MNEFFMSNRKTERKSKVETVSFTGVPSASSHVANKAKSNKWELDMRYKHLQNIGKGSYGVVSKSLDM